MAASGWQQPDMLMGGSATLSRRLARPRETSAAATAVSWSRGEPTGCDRGIGAGALPQPCPHPPAPTHSGLSSLLGLRRLPSSSGWWNPLAFAIRVWLKEFRVSCLWCGEEKVLPLDPELPVKYLTTILRSLATRRTSCCGAGQGMGRRRHYYRDFITRQEKKWKTLSKLLKLPEIDGLLCLTVGWLWGNGHELGHLRCCIP